MREPALKIPFRLAAAGALLLGGAFLPGCAPEADGPRVVEAAPDFALADLTGKTVRLSDLRGKVVLLDFWATYCLPCQDAIPELVELHKANQAKGFEVVGISVDAYSGHVPDFAKEHKMSYTVVLDPDQGTAKTYGFSQLPTTFLIGRDGRIIRKWLGYNEIIGSEIKEEVKAALG